MPWIQINPCPAHSMIINIETFRHGPSVIDGLPRQKKMVPAKNDTQSAKTTPLISRATSQLVRLEVLAIIIGSDLRWLEVNYYSRSFFCASSSLDPGRRWSISRQSGTSTFFKIYVEPFLSILSVGYGSAWNPLSLSLFISIPCSSQV